MTASSFHGTARSDRARLDSNLFWHPNCKYELLTNFFLSQYKSVPVVYKWPFETFKASLVAKRSMKD